MEAKVATEAWEGLSATRKSDLNSFSTNILIFSFKGLVFTKADINSQRTVFLLIILLLHVLSLSYLGNSFWSKSIFFKLHW